MDARTRKLEKSLRIALDALARLEDACSGPSETKLPYEHPARVEARAAIVKVEAALTL